MVTAYDKMETDSFKDMKENLKTQDITVKITPDKNDDDSDIIKDSDDDNMIVMSPKKLHPSPVSKTEMNLKFCSGSPNKSVDTKNNLATKTRCIGPFKLVNKYVILLLVAKEAADGQFLYCFSNFLVMNTVENNMNTFFSDMMVDSDNIYYLVDKDGKEICHQGTAKSTGNSYDKKIGMIAVYMETKPSKEALAYLSSSFIKWLKIRSSKTKRSWMDWKSLTRAIF